MVTTHLAIDMGAGSGRAILGVLEGGGDDAVLRLEELHRFEHEPCDTPAGPVWDLTGLWRHTLEGVRLGAARSRELGTPLTSVGVDTWGVDFGLVSATGEALSLPRAYRDPRNGPARDRVLAAVGEQALYEHCGLQAWPFNTLFQLEARRHDDPNAFASAERLLLLPDLLHYWLTGVMTNEATIASTTAMLHRDGDRENAEVLASLGLRAGMLGPLSPPGTAVGPLRAELRERIGVDLSTTVVLPATHDTAAAVAATPVDPRHAAGEWAYLSSGTWSLLGAELASPITSPEAAAGKFTNERGVDATVRFLKNIGGLWIYEELRRDLRRVDREYSHEELLGFAEESRPMASLVDPNHPDLMAPGQSIGKLRRLARERGEVEPITPGALARCCLDSLALSYAQTLGNLERVLGSRIAELCVVGGGVQNRLLARLTTDAVARPTSFGPVEATAIGNALVQAKGLGLIDGLPALRAVVRRSFPPERMTPAGDASLHVEASRRFERITANSPSA
ncbi:MAG: rhamnulokinase [Lacipirellulaceae bacterium]